LWDAYAWCDEVLIESDPHEILPFLPLTNHASMLDYVSLARWQTISDLLADAGADPAQVCGWKPWAVLLTLEAALQRYAPGVEAQFMQAAAKHDKPVYMLETGASVADLLDQVPVEVVTRYIADILDEPDQARRRARQLHDGWSQRSLAAMYVVARETPVFQNPALNNAILGERNRRWLPRLKQALQSPRRALVVVGALHLCGPDSVPALLADAGYCLHHELPAPVC